MKVLLITSSQLKLNVLTRVCRELVPNVECNISQYVGAPKRYNHYTSKENSLKELRAASQEVISQYPEFDYYVSMIGRFDDFTDYMEECALVLVQAASGEEGYSQAASFLVPEEVSLLLRQGVSFSEAVEKVYTLNNVKEGSGFVGFLTKGIVDKAEQYFQPLAIAFSTCMMRVNSSKECR